MTKNFRFLTLPGKCLFLIHITLIYIRKLYFQHIMIYSNIINQYMVQLLVGLGFY